MLNKRLGSKQALNLLGYISILFACYALSTCQSKNTTTRSNPRFAENDSSKVDSVFAMHFEVLNAFFEKQYDDLTLENLQDAITFFEFISNIKSQTDGTRYGKIYASGQELKHDIGKWEAWYRKNRSNLKWDNNAKRVIFGENQ